MSIIVHFSSGESWRTASRGWDEITELARMVLAEQGLGCLAEHLHAYGMRFDMQPDEVRLPVARAMLTAARRRWETALATGGDGDHVRKLVDLLEMEAATTERPPFVRFAGTRWSTTIAEWERLATLTRKELTSCGHSNLAHKIRLPGLAFHGTEGDHLARAMLVAARELLDEDRGSGKDLSHLRKLVDLLVHRVAIIDQAAITSSRPPGNKSVD